MQFQSSGREESLEEDMATPTPVFLPGESHGQKSLALYIVHGIIKNQTQLSMHAHTYIPNRSPSQHSKFIKSSKKSQVCG